MLHLRTLGGLGLCAPEGELLVRRRHALAVLAVLAGRAPAGVRREEIQTLFWGERTEEKARHSLRQVVLQLRRVLGDAIDVDSASLRLAPDLIQLDARHFTQVASEGRCRDAIDLWTGDFLMGCEELGAEGFHTWLEVERERLRRLLAFCYERTVVELESSGDLDRAAWYATSWTERFPLDERAHLRLIETLCALGRVADANVAHGTFIQRLHADMEDAPSTEWLAATKRMLRDARGADEVEVRARLGNGRAEPHIDVVPETVAISPVVVPHTAIAARRSLLLPFLGAAAVLCAVVVFGARIATAHSGRPATIAVGRIASSPGSDSLDGFGTLLAITLARIPGLDLISERRMSEVAAGTHSTNTDAVARIAGAKEVIEGVLMRRADGSLRADLRRTDLSTGKARGAYTVEGTDLAQLADLLTEQIARDFNVSIPVARREGTTSSIVAYRFYELGLKSYYAGDVPAARRFFTSALAEDSTFAMAALYTGLTVRVDSADAFMAQAVRHAQRTTERERLLINITWGRRMADPRVLAWADTLVTRYPSETDAHLAYAQEQKSRANLTEALSHFRRVLEMDSATGPAMAHCRSCDALADMIEIYRDADSLTAAERLARTWLRWLPHSQSAWLSYSLVLGQADRLAEAHAAVDSAGKYSSEQYPLAHAVWWFRGDDYESVDRASQIAEQTAQFREDGLWTRVISSGAQGRMRNALEAAREYRRYRRESGFPHVSNALLEAVVLAESGQPRSAAVLFDSIARFEYAPFPSRVSASRAWVWTHAAGAYASAGDTAALRRLEDSVRVNGSLATERYKRLHHYVHGLLLATQHKPAEAAESFRRAVWVRQSTHVRIYLELARALLDAGRSAEAIPPLRDALRGPVSAAGLYATRTELQQLLALAYERSGQPDSALKQYALVSRAWRNADPEFAERRASIDARISALTSLHVRR